MESIRSLWIQGTEITITGVNRLQRHPAIEVLGIDDTLYTQFLEVHKFPNLKTIELRKCTDVMSVGDPHSWREIEVRP